MVLLYHMAKAQGPRFGPTACAYTEGPADLVCTCQPDTLAARAVGAGWYQLGQPYSSAVHTSWV